MPRAAQRAQTGICIESVYLDIVGVVSHLGAGSMADSTTARRPKNKTSATVQAVCDRLRDMSPEEADVAFHAIVRAASKVVQQMKGAEQPKRKRKQRKKKKGKRGGGTPTTNTAMSGKATYMGEQIHKIRPGDPVYCLLTRDDMDKQIVLVTAEGEGFGGNRVMPGQSIRYDKPLGGSEHEATLSVVDGALKASEVAQPYESLAKMVNSQATQWDKQGSLATDRFRVNLKGLLDYKDLVLLEHRELH